MKPLRENIEKAIRASSRQELAAALHPRHLPLSLIEVNQLLRRLKEFDEPAQQLTVVAVRSYTTELLKPYWELEAALNGFRLEFHTAPFGVLPPQDGAIQVDLTPDVTYFFLRWEDLDPDFALPIAGLSTAEVKRIVDAARGRLQGMLKFYCQTVPGQVVVTLLPRMSRPELGQYEAMVETSEREVRWALKRQIVRDMREGGLAASFEDLDELTAEVGRGVLFDARMWHTSRYPFSVAGAQALVRRLMTYPLLLKTPRAKVIVLDADNTLWGGIIGEDQLHGIALGPDYPGSAFVAFQRRLLDFQQRGILLALCSKNNLEDVMDVLRNHPHQVLREQHFAGIRVNWEPKVDNLRALAAELNLGLDSFVFLEDSPHECYQVRRHLPEVRVVQTPTVALEIPFCLDDVPALEVLRVTQEDQQRTAMYAQEKRRKQLAVGTQDHGEYLRSLEMAMTVAFDEPAHTPRLAQLTQKTNQFNLTTHRYLEADIRKMIADANWLVADFTLVDLFGDSGIVGVGLVRGMEQPVAEVDTFLLSCRVIGRGAETAFLHAILGDCAARGVKRLRGRYLPTAKNNLVKAFWRQQGFTEVGTDVYELDLEKWQPPESGRPPIRVQVLRSSIGLPLSVSAID
jgi:FkbH-like protein